MSNDETRFNELKAQFGSEGRADQLTLNEFSNLTDARAGTLVDRVAKTDIKIAGEISAIRKRAIQASQASQQPGKTLRDGIPELQQIITSSGASVPLEICHARCSHNVVSEFQLLQVEDSFFSSRNLLWDNVVNTLNGNKLKYATEASIVYYVRTFLKNIINAMKLNYDIETDFGIKGIASDICIITEGNRLIGVVEVKKPDHGALDKPTILGKLFDQMILVEGFYCTGPVIGILTTLEEWRFAWFPQDNEHFIEDNWASFQTEGFLTSTKTKATPDSPPGNTPSQSGYWAHGIYDEDETEDSEEEEEENSPHQLPEMDRTLNVTEVLNIYENYGFVLQHIYSAFKRMSQVKLSYRNGVPRVLFQLHRDKYNISYHPISDIPLDMEKLCSSKYPKSTTTSLLAIEDLGRGSSGKAWLACTRTKSRNKTPAICVLKYGNKGRFGLEYEKGIWEILYPEFTGKIKLEMWSGSLALVMPHFCSVALTDRNMYQESIEALLIERFHNNGYIHRDVAWRNIGFYAKDGGNVPILYDLETVRKLNDQDDPNWIKIAMIKLFGNLDL